MHMERTVEAYLAIVEYIDLCQYSSTSTQDFFATASLTELSIMGWCMEMREGDYHVLKILYVQSHDLSENSEGMVIPISCVKSIQKLDVCGEEDRLMNTKENN